jgi:hypothetical protein
MTVNTAETILIADCEAAVRACIRHILGAAGFSVLEPNPAVATAKTGPARSRNQLQRRKLSPNR